MNTHDSIFQRRECKYFLKPQQYEQLMALIDKYMALDAYGDTLVCSCYYDTPDYRLIRRSMEKEIYKEKLRLRSYGVPEKNGKVYLELKKKYQGVVYKRREPMLIKDALCFLEGRTEGLLSSQILKEIAWAINYYGVLRPSMYISYMRNAFYVKPERMMSLTEREFRVTFDSDIVWRTDNVNLMSGSYGDKLLPEGCKIMEVKSIYAMPIWFSDILNELGIYSCSFSKYGNAYASMINNMTA